MAKTTGKPQPARSVPTPKMKRGFRSFWTDVMREMKKVDWPPAREVNRLTGVVLAVCLFVVVVLYGLAQVAATVVNLVQGKLV